MGMIKKPQAPDLVKEIIMITAVGQFGPKVGEVWYGLNDPLQSTDFIAGHSYEVLVKVSGPSDKNPAGGKRYIAQILGEVQAPVTAEAAAPVPSTDPVKLVNKAAGMVLGPRVEAAQPPKARDYAAEARGKTRCVQFEAALMSPSIAGLQLDTLEKILDACRKAADYGTTYTFEDR